MSKPIRRPIRGGSSCWAVRCSRRNGWQTVPDSRSFTFYSYDYMYRYWDPYWGIYWEPYWPYPYGFGGSFLRPRLRGSHSLSAKGHSHAHASGSKGGKGK